MYDSPEYYKEPAAPRLSHALCRIPSPETAAMHVLEPQIPRRGLLTQRHFHAVHPQRPRYFLLIDRHACRAQRFPCRQECLMRGAIVSPSFVN